MATRWITLPGLVIEGYGVASGRDSTRFPGGTISAQMPHFRARGVDLSPYYPGTINVSIAPRSLSVIRPDLTLHDVSWWPGIPAETFSFSPCRIVIADLIEDGVVYYPHPETKPDHHHPATIVEVLAPFIDGLHTGSSLELLLDRHQVSISG